MKTHICVNSEEEEEEERNGKKRGENDYSVRVSLDARWMLATVVLLQCSRYKNDIIYPFLYQAFVRTHARIQIEKESVRYPDTLTKEEKKYRNSYVQPASL